MAGRVWSVLLSSVIRDTVFKYIQNQEEHHKVQTFGEEYLGLLKEFKVEYDEQYIFQDLI